MQNLIKIFNKLCNPLLYYIDKEGNSIFKNYSFFKNDGWLYDEVIRIKDAGDVLEYRLETDKKLTLFNVIIILILYIISIHVKLNIWLFIGFVFAFVVLFYVERIIFSKKYSQKLIMHYGHYQTVDFKPHLKKEKLKLYRTNFISKAIVFFVILCILFSPSLFLLNGIRYLANKKEPNLSHIKLLTGTYSIFYPKTPLIYDINAISKYKNKDYIGAANDYIRIFKMSGKNFSNHDYRRFANLLYLIKKTNGVRDAIDKFNEYTTIKNTTISEQLKLLWIKSNFCISSGTYEFIAQDYDDLLKSVTNNKQKYQFYILADKAYMLYLMKDYPEAIKIYNNLIPYASEYIPKELTSLYLERGFAKLEFGDKEGANNDFISSKVNINEIGKYEPTIINPEFIIGDF